MHNIVSQAYSLSFIHCTKLHLMSLNSTYVIHIYHIINVAKVSFVQGVKRGLPSLISTNTLPLSPLLIRSSPSRYVVSNHDWAFLLEMENLRGGRLEMVFTTDEAVSWTELSKPLKGASSIFCPRNSTFSGITSESVSCGVPITPSSNLIWNNKVIETKLIYSWIN